LGDLEIGAFIEEMGLAPEVLDDLFAGAALEWLDLDRALFE
jgi:aminocarboxymuconate-semialdehyde decarboxylase